MNRALSLKRRLAWMGFMSCSITMLVAGAAFVAYEVVALRSAMVRDLSAQAQIVGFNTAPAIVFRDAHAATETLAASRGNPHILAMSIFTADGRMFARYARGNAPESTLPPLPSIDIQDDAGHRFTRDQLVVYQSIVADGIAVGRLYVQSDLDEIRERVLRSILITMTVMLLSLAFGSFWLRRLLKRVTEPIGHLVEASRRISQRDYNVRCQVDSIDELGTLAATFNDMVAQIEARDTELRAAHESLERRVEERTIALREEVAERRRLEDELRRKNEALEAQNQRVEAATRLKSEFLANMSHELRTPLNAIIGFTEVLYDGRVGPVAEQHREFLGDILTSSRHLLQLINDILDLSKVEAGKMDLRPERVSLTKLIGEVRDILRTLAARKHIQIDVDIDPAVDDVIIDPSKLKQVLYNYLSNAIKFTPDAGSVTVRAKPEGTEEFCIEVEDTGIGIRAEDMDRLFKEFEQLDATAAKKYQGTGLGLALTARLLELQGGSHRVTSVYGRGSIFAAVLPRDATEKLRVSPRRKPCVLVVEDDVNDRRYIVDALRAAGYAVEQVATGADAIAAAAKRQFDAVTLDLLLPDVSGLDVLRALRREGLNQETPVIIVTVVAERGVSTGFAIHDFLVKPLRTDDLLQSLRRIHGEPAGAGGRDYVLVVDDDPNARRLMEVTLRDLGYDSATAIDGATGLEVVRRGTPLAIVLDLLMPGMNGFDFLARLRELPVGHSIPVIVWTSKDLSADERGRLSGMAETVLAKGAAGPQALIDALAAHLPAAHPKHTLSPDVLSSEASLPPKEQLHGR